MVIGVLQQLVVLIALTEWLATGLQAKKTSTTIAYIINDAHMVLHTHTVNTYYIWGILVCPVVSWLCSKTCFWGATSVDWDVWAECRPVWRVFSLALLLNSSGSHSLFSGSPAWQVTCSKRRSMLKVVKQLRFRIWFAYLLPKLFEVLCIM